MAYVSSDLTLIENAIKDFISGDRKSKVKFRDGREVEFARVSLTELRSLRSEIQTALASASRPRRAVFTTSKGL